MTHLQLSRAAGTLASMFGPQWKGVIFAVIDLPLPVPRELRGKHGDIPTVVARLR